MINYIYPPRVENRIAPESLLVFEETGSFFAQPKLNGSSMQIYFSDGAKEIVFMNRHKEVMSCKIDIEEIRKLYRGSGEMILCGEYMNKSQKGIDGKPFNIKYVIWDIIKLNNKHLLGTAFSERYKLLHDMYELDETVEFLEEISPNCFIVKKYSCNFSSVHEKITKIEMIEGLVLKKSNSKLEHGHSKNNNHKSQIKCRKETKNYSF